MVTMAILHMARRGSIPLSLKFVLKKSTKFIIISIKKNLM